MEYTTIITKEDIQELIDSDVTDGNGWVEVNQMFYDEKTETLKVIFDIRR